METAHTPIVIGDDDLTLPKGERVWITVGNLSVRIAYTYDDNVNVDIYHLGHENENAVVGRQTVKQPTRRI